MKKIFFIIASFSKGGGAESLLTTIVNNLNPNKYEIGIMEIVHDVIKVEPTNANIKIYPYYVEESDPERNTKMYYVYHEWDKVIADYIPQDYDMYVSFNRLKPSFLLPPGKKNIAWIHGDLYKLAQEDMTEERELQNEAFYKAKRIVAISDITTQSIESLFPEHKDKIRTIYNGIDIEKVRKQANETALVNLEHPAILSVGRLDANKNPLHLLNIYEQVHRKRNDVHLYYLGYGDLQEAVASAANEKGISDQVHFLGYYDNPFPIMVQCDVIGMFSVSEGFPMALLEGVALDKPFVSSVIGGSRILANGQRCGRTAETDEEAVNAILNFLSADQSIVKKECCESIQRFALADYIRQIEELFEEVMNS